MADKRNRPTFKGLSPYDTPALIIKNLSKEEQRKEYTTLRDIFQKRFKRMEEAGIENQSEFYLAWHNKYYKNGVPKLSSLKKKQIPYILASMKRMGSEYKTATIAGTRKAAKARADALARAHYNVPEEDIPDFKRFMEQWRSRKLDHVIGSPVVVEMYEKYHKNFVSEEVFDNWEIFKKHLHDPEEAGIYEDLSRLEKPDTQPRGEAHGKKSQSDNDQKLKQAKTNIKKIIQATAAHKEIPRL